MKYDPIELMKLNLTQESIDKYRQGMVDLFTADTGIVITYIDSFWLPFIIDMFEGYKITIEPYAHSTKLTLYLK